MSVLQAIILGIIQGITELLPISSSAHLNVIPWILNWTKNPEFNEMFEGAFDVALHAGTLLAVTIFFAKDWIQLIGAGFNKVVKKEDTVEGKMFWQLVAATIPAGIAALVLDKISDIIIGDNFKLEMGFIAAALVIMGIILYIVDKNAKSTVEYKDINMKQSVLVGISQAVAAAFPGVSRSGITMTVSRTLGIDRESAAKFSFLLSTPIIAAAVLADFKEFALTSPVFWIGVISSFISGLVVIKFLMDYLRKGSFKIFAGYRVVLGAVIVALLVVR